MSSYPVLKQANLADFGSHMRFQQIDTFYEAAFPHFLQHMS